MTDLTRNLPNEIMVWHSHERLDHIGSWATTRYPEEAVAYVSKTALAEAQAAQAGVCETLAARCDEHARHEVGREAGMLKAHAAYFRSIADQTGVKLLAELRQREANLALHAANLADQLAEAQKREAGLREALAGIAAYSDIDHREFQRRWPDLHEKIVAERDHECPARDYILSQYAVAALSAAPTGEESNG